MRLSCRSVRVRGGREPSEERHGCGVRLDLPVLHVLEASRDQAAVPEPQIEAGKEWVTRVRIRSMRSPPRPVPPFRLVVVLGELEHVAEKDRVELRTEVRISA